MINCNNFLGLKGTSNSGEIKEGDRGVFALRKIVFRTGFFHSQLYPDDTTLDFVISFGYGKLVSNNMSPEQYDIASAQLINAYTIENSMLADV